jgi:hypothetical protein
MFIHSKKQIYSSLIITAVIFSGLGYYAGMKKSSSDSPRQFQGGQRASRGFGGGGVTQGEVISFDNQMLTLKGRDGGSKVIVVTDTTKVLKSVTGVKSDVKTGSSVVIMGTQNSDGSITAETLQLRDGLPQMRSQGQ